MDDLPGAAKPRGRMGPDVAKASSRWRGERRRGMCDIAFTALVHVCCGMQLRGARRTVYGAWRMVRAARNGCLARCALMPSLLRSWLHPRRRTLSVPSTMVGGMLDAGGCVAHAVMVPAAMLPGGMRSASSRLPS
jgi:hypothetical protein